MLQGPHQVKFKQPCAAVAQNTTFFIIATIMLQTKSLSPAATIVSGTNEGLEFCKQPKRHKAGYFIHQR